MNVAETILKQLGGNRFIAMTGSKNFLNGGDYLSFHLPSNMTRNKINVVKIALNANDLYDMTFMKVKLSGKNVGDYTVVSKITDVYCDNLQYVFTDITGLDTRL